MKSELVLVFVIIVFIIYYIDPSNNTEVLFVMSNIDGKRYIVRNLPDRKKAANLLALINQNSLKLIDHLIKKFPDDERIIQLKNNYNPDAISEGNDSAKYTSYSINKGEKIIFCLRDKITNKLTDLNTLLYINYHELGHLATKSVGHTKEFWDNFKFILGEAVKIGLYKVVDYGKAPIPYCGIKITSNVLLEKKEEEKKK